MAYIDPDGMFGGDRMALLSDSAKMAWPWFWCASNTVGRVELNYREFVNGPFRQFRKPPAEKQFWEWVTEFHESFLMFAYQVNGQAWGQWDVSERYLPTHKKKLDKLTPAPNAGAFLSWRGKYQNLKISELSNKCPIFSNSEEFPKISRDLKSFEGFPIGEERRGEEKTNMRAPETGALALVPSKPHHRNGKAQRDIAQIRRDLGIRLPWFEALCSVHPAGKEGVKAGMEAFERRVTPDDAGHRLAKEMYRGAVAYAAKCAADPTVKVKWLQGWINDERWTDEHRARDSPPPQRPLNLYVKPVAPPPEPSDDGNTASQPRY